ncbi:activin receptor type-2A-like [Galleria mellonella]|uniref:Serine/threonine-protein kinase receptor n=1 Tax=Galleria mellonella TaxID=7137 RepID=A0ABM3MAP4_GALME|nr:activin receptor type-2A-like [Galleria mellonella]
MALMMAQKMVLHIVLFVLGTTFAAPPNDENLPPRPREGGVTTRYCAFYNDSKPCDPNNSTSCIQTPEKEECLPTETTDKSSHCFVLWQFDNVTNTAYPKVKGCFLDTVSCTDRAFNCRLHNIKLPLLHCCCEGDMCNQNVTFPGLEVVLAQTDAPVEIIPASPVPTSDDDTKAVIAYTLTPLFLLFAILLACYFLYRRRKGSSFAELASGEPSLSRPPSATAGMENEGLGLVGQITLCEVRARGRFGAVWRAKYGQMDVAVKVFPLQDKQSWMAEQEIYRLPRMDHPDILHFIGVDKKGDNLQAEYRLITAYHEKGSLCDYLKANTLTWAEAWRVAVCVARGLAHLHEEVGGKPAVAHRDFKSKNVLLKADMSACIADFGLALVFAAGRGCGDAHGQVGTRRYMAPEVLDGAINFTKDAFLRIDMYACALVLWEIASRCTDVGAEPTAQYRLPLEEEVGSHPSLEEMQEAVVQRKLRPLIPAVWRDHPGLSVVCDTMEECWDHDAEARLSASCVLERVTAQRPAAAAPAAGAAAAAAAAAADTAPLLIHHLAPPRAC